MTAKKRCKGTNKAGKSCGSSGVWDNGYCIAHQPKEVQESHGFGGAQPGSGSPRKPRPHEVWREVLEQDVLALMEPSLRAAGLEVVDGRLSRREEGGAKLHGTSKDGHVKVSHYDDLEAMQRAIDRLLDRVYGRPRQQTEITGPEGGPVEVTALDLSRLSTKELRTLRDLAAKADAGSPEH